MATFIELDEPMGPGFFIFFHPEEEVEEEIKERLERGGGGDGEGMKKKDIEIIEMTIGFLTATDE